MSWRENTTVLCLMCTILKFQSGLCLDHDENVQPQIGKIITLVQHKRLIKIWLMSVW